jgi:hypothetical protein
MDPQKVEIFGCWGNQHCAEPPRSFAFKMRINVNAGVRAQVQLRRGAVENASDVFCCVNTYTRNHIVQQPPLLVLPQVRCARAQGLPDTVEPITMSEDRVAQLKDIASVIVDDKYGCHHIARELSNIALNTALPTLDSPGWIE